MNSKTRYTVDLADLQLIADAACELDATKQFYVDQPGEQQRLANMTARLLDTVERAARSYGESEEVRL